MQHSIRSNIQGDPHSQGRTPRTAPKLPSDGTGDERERAVLAGVLLPNTNADLANPLGELASLAESAGVHVVDSLIQKRMSLSPTCAFGKGKLEELALTVEAGEADVVIMDNDLTPRQIRSLERKVERKVIDRSELILDIFASRARTREAQLQVELAQLQYTAPRLRGMWTHLERIAGAGGGTAAGAVGGVGTRGPGERQIEMDRRIVKDRIAYLSRQIRDIDERKKREVKSRGDQFTISLVGYTNSGKSTMMNKLTDAGRFVADMVFATLDTKTARWDLGDGYSGLLSDTVGFVRNLPHHLVASFRATLEEAIHASLLLHVVDISSPTAWQQMEAVEVVLAELSCDDVPRITVLNKIDQATSTDVAEMISYRCPGAVRTSALSGEGLDALRQAVLGHMLAGSADVTIRLPHSDGKAVADIDASLHVRDRRYLPEGVELDVHVNRTQLRQLRGRHPNLCVVQGMPDGWIETDSDE